MLFLAQPKGSITSLDNAGHIFHAAVAYFHSIFVEDLVEFVRYNRTIVGNNFKNTEEGCNCRDKYKCSLENKCLSTRLVYKACVSTDENTEVNNYIRLTEGTFKQRFNGHQLSFRNKRYAKQHRIIKICLETKE